MSVAKAQRLLLDRLAAGETALLALHLATPGDGWADGMDAEGRSVYLVGAHALRQIPEGETAVAAVLDALRAGFLPDAVHGVAYAPASSSAWQTVVMTDAEQVLKDGPRGSGKTQGTPGELGGLAERHHRAGYPFPLKALWLHSSLVNARAKTIPSLEQAHWAGLWSARDDGTLVVLTVGGVEMVHAHFVGTQDQTAQERARAECHVVVAEEVIASLDDAGGIDARIFDLARNSARLPTPRRVAVAVTNPGDVDTWPYRRWIEGGGQPGCVRCPVPATDRLTPEEAQRQIDDFTDSPDLQARLGRGEWSALHLGELVAEGYDPAVHVAPARMLPDAGHALVIGWDGGGQPSAVVGQVIGGQVRIYAVFNRTQGVEELALDEVVPWLETWAPWARTVATLRHVIDPSMRTKAEATRRVSSERAILDTCGGRIESWPRSGQDPWPPRREAVARVCGPRLVQGKVGLQVNPGADTHKLRHALGSRWIYPRTADGRTDRSHPKKPNPPWADVGDAFAYLCGGLMPGRAPIDESQYQTTRYARSALTPFHGEPRRAASGLS